jgi:hypothetical protein
MAVEKTIVLYTLKVINSSNEGGVDDSSITSSSSSRAQQLQHLLVSGMPQHELCFMVAI